MDLASSPIRVVKNRVGRGVAACPKKLDRCEVKHEIAVLILTGIRESARKRRKQTGRGGAFGKEHFEGSTPTPGGFWQRVRKPLKTKELRFARAQKSAQG